MKKIDVGNGLFATVDSKDFDLLKKYKWHTYGSNSKKNIRYAKHSFRSEKGYSHFLMHSLILNTPKGMVVDHIDGNGLNNCRSNLRICTSEQNLKLAAYRKNEDLYTCEACGCNVEYSQSSYIHSPKFGTKQICPSCAEICTTVLCHSFAFN